MKKAKVEAEVKNFLNLNLNLNLLFSLNLNLLFSRQPNEGKLVSIYSTLILGSMYT
ncbi:MAG: hypothetical protein AAB014_05155 [Nitrospirota bacterium]